MYIIKVVCSHCGTTPRDRTQYDTTDQVSTRDCGGAPERESVHADVNVEGEEEEIDGDITFKTLFEPSGPHNVGRPLSEQERVGDITFKTMF